MAGRNLLAPNAAPGGRNLLPRPTAAPAAAPERSTLGRIADAYMRGRQQLKPYQDQALADLANPGKAAQAVDDMARIGIDTASFGFADPAIGFLTGEDERAKTQTARDRAGWAGTGMDVATAVAATPALAGRVVSAGKGVLPAFGRMLGYGAEGAGQAALSAVGHGERDLGKIGEQAALGGGLGTAGQAAGGRASSWLQRRQARAAQPFKSSGDIKAASSAKYGEVDRSGAHYPITDTDTLLQDLDRVLADETATPGLDDRAITVVRELKKNWQGKPINPRELDKVRRWVDKKLVASNPRGPDAELGYRLKEEIDAFTGKTDPIDPVTGRPNQQVNATLRDARALAARRFRVEAIENAAAKAKKQAQRTGSALTGGNIENTTRQQFDRLATKIDEGKTGGYSPEEVDRIKQIAGGTTGRNIGRAGSVMSPLRGGWPAVVHMGLGPLTGGLSTVAGIGGEVASQFGQRATAREVEDLAALARDPSGRGLQIDPAQVQMVRDYLARLMVGGQRASQQGGPR